MDLYEKIIKKFGYQVRISFVDTNDAGKDKVVKQDVAVLADSVNEADTFVRVYYKDLLNIKIEQIKEIGISIQKAMLNVKNKHHKNKDKSEDEIESYGSGLIQ